MVLFYNMRNVKLNLRVSATLTIKETGSLGKSENSSKKVQRSIEKLESLYHEWKTIQKSSKRLTEMQIKREQVFLEKLDDLFDIAHANALQMINIEEINIFLFNQRKKGRLGSMIGVDYVLSAKEKKLELCKNVQEMRIAKSQRAIQS